MQADLSYYSHTIECSFLIERMERCYAAHPLGKFFGYCDKEASDVILCCHEERMLKRKNNPRYSRRPEENHCLPESSYTATLKKLKEEGVLVIRPEVSDHCRMMNESTEESGSLYPTPMSEDWSRPIRLSAGSFWCQNIWIMAGSNHKARGRAYIF